MGDILENAREQHHAEMITSDETIGPTLRNLAASLGRLLGAA